MCPRGGALTLSGALFGTADIIYCCLKGKDERSTQCGKINEPTRTSTDRTGTTNSSPTMEDGGLFVLNDTVANCFVKRNVCHLMSSRVELFCEHVQLSKRTRRWRSNSKCITKPISHIQSLLPLLPLLLLLLPCASYIKLLVRSSPPLVSSSSF